MRGIAIGTFLEEDPTWRVYIPFLPKSYFVHPSYKDVVQQDDTASMLYKAQVTTALNACLHTAVQDYENDLEHTLEFWRKFGWDLGAEVSVYQVEADGTYTAALLADPKPKSVREEAPAYGDRPKALWLDVDGTSFTMFDETGTARRGPFEYHKVHLDTPLQHTIDIVKVLQEAGYKVVVLSGREETCKEATVKAFEDVGITPDAVFMRPEGSNIPDDQLKYDIYRQEVEPHFDIKFAFDDRDKVVKMLRTKLNIPTYQVNYGAF